MEGRNIEKQYHLRYQLTFECEWAFLQDHRQEGALEDDPTVQAQAAAEAAAKAAVVAEAAQAAHTSPPSSPLWLPPPTFDPSSIDDLSLEAHWQKPPAIIASLEREPERRCNLALTTMKSTKRYYIYIYFNICIYRNCIMNLEIKIVDLSNRYRHSKCKCLQYVQIEDISKSIGTQVAGESHEVIDQVSILFE